MSVDWGRIRAVCLDMDGTLVNSDAAWLNATRAAFARFGMELADAHYQETLGLDNREGVRVALRHFPSFKGSVDDLVRALEEEIQGAFRRGITPMPGAEALLARWRTRWPLALVSTSSEALIGLALEGLKWESFFTVRLSSESVGPSKPDPAVYREAVRRLGVEPSAALALEDSLNGVKSAHAAGLQVIGLAAEPGLRRAMEPHVAALYPNLTAVPA